jgi:putative membrane protein
MVLVGPFRRMSPVIFPALLVVVFTGRRGEVLTLVMASAVLVAMLAGGVVGWVTTRYRVTAERVELRSGLLLRKHLSVPRDRIRTVDVTAGPLLRVVGLASVAVGTGLHSGSSGSSEMTLDGVPAGNVEALRRSLLGKSPVAAVDPAGLTGLAPAGPAPTGPALTGPGPTGPVSIGDDRPAGDPVATRAAKPEMTISQLDWAWLRFAPLTLSGLVAVGAVVGGGFNLLDSLGIQIADSGAVEDAVDGVGSAPLWFVFTSLAAVVVVVTVASAVLLYVEAWWRYRLVREGDATFLVRRGLLTTRSVSIEEKRLRGIEVVEPMILRWGRGARASAIASGLSTSSGFGDPGSLLPPAPRGEAHRLARVMLAETELPEPPIVLHRHPTAALRRRLVRRLVPVAVVVGVLASIGPTRAWAWLAAALLVPLAIALAVDAYRNLGHRLAGSCLLARDGALVRRTVALRRGGVIGWTVSQSLFQRRAGLATVTATTAAGRGGCQVVDVGLSQGLAFAADAVPGLLEPFLVRVEPASVHPVSNEPVSD